MTEVQPVKIITVQKGQSLPQKYTVPPAAKRNIPLYEGLKTKRVERLVAVNNKNEVVGCAGYTQPGNGIGAAKQLFSNPGYVDYYRRTPVAAKHFLVAETERRLSPTKRIDLGWIGSIQPGVGTKLVDKLKSVGRSRGVKVIDGYTRNSAIGFYKKQGATSTTEKIGRCKYYAWKIKTNGRRK